MAMIKYLPLFLLTFGLYSCNTDTDTADTTTPADSTKVAAPVEPAALAALSEAERKQYLEEYGIDIYRGVPEGLKVGQTAPIFKATDHTGKELFLPDLYKDGPLVIAFYRGAWCPACNRHLAALEDSIQHIYKTGAKLIAISPETRDKVNETIDKTKAKYPVIADPDGYIMTAYKLDFFVAEGYTKMINDKLSADIATYNGTSEARLPIPATYIIGTDGKIKYVHFNPDYHVRASVQEIITELNKLK